MTRINCIPPWSELYPRQYLAAAEYRELPRIFALVREAIARGEQAPADRRNLIEYTLGTGHVRFFIRGWAIWWRQRPLILEMQARLSAELCRGGSPDRGHCRGVACRPGADGTGHKAVNWRGYAERLRTVPQLPEAG